MDYDDGLRIRGDEPGPNADAHRRRYQWAAEMLPEGAAVLDFGCGTGYGVNILRAAGLNAMGWDPDPSIRRAPGSSWIDDFRSARWDAVVCFEVLEHLDEAPLGTLMALEKLAPIVIASVPYMEPARHNKFHKWARLQESTFPGRAFAYQYRDGTISTMPGGEAQNLIVLSFARSES